MFGVVATGSALHNACKNSRRWGNQIGVVQCQYVIFCTILALQIGVVIKDWRWERSPMQKSGVGEG
eukprot:5150460-Karenia_brevis.AAC.1